MKFINLKTKRVHQRTKLEERSPGTLEGFTKPSAVSKQIHTYTELRQQFHDDLRIQHPEWIQPDGESPMCDAYEARFRDLLGAFMRRG